jgi:hypothetical protein
MLHSIQQPTGHHISDNQMMALMIDIDCCSQLELAMCGLKCCLTSYLQSTWLSRFYRKSDQGGIFSDQSEHGCQLKSTRAIGMNKCCLPSLGVWRDAPLLYLDGSPETLDHKFSCILVTDPIMHSKPTSRYRNLNLQLWQSSPAQRFCLPLTNRL